MAESGFGSPTYNPAPAINDAGFGSPFIDGTGRDTGFGSPFDPSLLPLSIQGETYLIGDDGGVRLDISGQWFAFSGTPVPAHTDKFKVKFRHTDGTLHNALAGKMGDQTGGQVYSNPRQTVLYAIVPPLPHGLYDVLVQWDGQTALISDAFEVTARNKAAETFSIRANLPAFMKRGSLTAKDENTDIAPTYGVIEALTRSVGQIVQRFTGRPETLVSQQWDEGDATLHVETTVGFPESGYLLIDGVKLKYTAKTNNTFTGVDYYVGAVKPTFKYQERVVPYVDPRE
jgi:hypothetical protein